MDNKTLTGYPSIDKPWLKNFTENADKIVSENQNLTVYQYLYNQNKDYQNEYAIRYFDMRITYGELFDNIERFAKALVGYGVKDGDYVTLCLPNIPEMIYLFFAICRIGAVANMIDPRMNPQGIVDKVSLSGSKLLITVIDICETKIDKIVEKLDVEKILIATPADSLKNIKLLSKAKLVECKYRNKANQFLKSHKDTDKYLFLNDFINKYYDDSIEIRDDFVPNKPIAVTYTSGTTGTPKGAQFSNEAYIAQHQNMKYAAEVFDRQSTFLGIIPMFSAYGSLGAMMLALCSGWEYISLPTFNPLKFDELIVKHKPNNLLGVPRFWETLLNSKKIDKTDLSFLNIPVTGGDKISPSVLERINNKLSSRGSKIRLKVGYGSTEIGGVLTATLDHKCYVPGSVGTVLPGGAVKIVDPDTLKELPYNTDGEIYAHSATQMLNYLNNPKETENILHIDENGVRYYKTGDKGYITEDGIVFIVDRYKRLMKRPDGHQVHASPIENVLNSHTDVLQCAVVGISQKGLNTGSIPTAFVVRKQSNTTDEEFAYELDKYCKVHLGERECALTYTFIEKMPYNTMGKIDFKFLEKNTFDTIKAVIVDKAFFK